MKILKYCPYRKGRAIGSFVIFPRDAMRSFEETLAQMAGVSIDNHTCYLVEFEYGVVRSFWFHDFSMIMGTGIEKSC